MDPEKRLSKVQELVYELKVSDAMTSKVITLTPQTLMSQLREVLRSNRISGTPILEDGRIVGIISIEDFIKWLADGAKDCPVKDKMVSNVKALFADEPLVQAVSQLKKFGYGRFPVIDRESGNMVGVITKGDIIARLLKEVEIDYHEEEIHRYRASHIFEDIIADKTTLIFQYTVKGKDFGRAGEDSAGIKKTLLRLGIHPDFVRRAAIASYEAELNLVIFTDGGEMSVKVRPDKINIIVKDNGPGIPEENCLKVFQRFYRLEQSRTTPGNGLGLSIVAAIVDLHGGTIVLSDNNPGLKIVLTFCNKQSDTL